MKERLIVAAISVPGLFIVLFFLPAYAFAILIALLCAVCAYELQVAADGSGNEGLGKPRTRDTDSKSDRANPRVSIYAVIAAVLIPVGAFFDISRLVFPAVTLVLMSLVFAEAFVVFGTERQISFTRILIALFGGALIPLMLSTLISLRNMPEGRLFALLPIISAFITDAGAYFGGVLFGKKRGFMMLSPTKTVEGFIGGFVLGMVSIIIYGIILIFTTNHGVIFWVLALYGLIGAAFTELGDLAFSLVKRECGIKDFGHLLPGHGGLLDRFDSMVFAAPGIYLLIALIPAIIVS